MDIYETTAIRELNEKLAVANKFDSDALILNRQGMLAPSQMQIVYKRLGFISFALLVFGYLAFAQYQKDGFSFVTALMLLFLFIMVRGVYVGIRNASQKEVESMEGVGYAVRTTSDDSDSHYYEIDGTRFLVRSVTPYRALVEGLRYRVYYLPKSQELVNIEALEAPQTDGL